MSFILAKEHLINVYPELRPAFTVLGGIELPNNETISVGEAITRIVIGQMLSRRAAQSIYSRVEQKKKENELEGSWHLGIDGLVAQGVSTRKARAIKEFGEQYDRNPDLFEAWRCLQHEEIRKKVSAHWGLSTWSADILSIFYFGLPDVFPFDDGTIKRVVQYINKELFKNQPFDPNMARPYRTYISLYLWKMVDERIFAI
jgi:DNA-3-methyladenine glycosylase II